MKKLISIIFVFLVLISFTSALITKEFVEDTEKQLELESETKYGTITLKERWWIDMFGWFEKEIKKITLESNTDVCGESCSATKEIKLYEKGKLVDDVYFETIRDDGSRIRQDIRSYQFYIQDGVNSYEKDTYEYKCSSTGKISVNGTAEQICSNIKTGTKTIEEPIWKEYNYEEVEAGDYVLKLVGKKEPSRTVDWIIVSKGRKLTEWAIWGTMSEEVMHYYKLDSTSGTIGIDEYGGKNITFDTDTWTTGILGNAKLADGTKGISEVNLNNLTEVSINLWINRTGNLNDGARLISNGETIANGEFYIVFSNAAQWLYVKFIHNSGESGIQIPYSDIPLNNWTMITFIINQTKLQGYANGILIDETNTGSWTGANNNVGFFYQIINDDRMLTNVTVDEIGIWNKSLSQSEINSFYNGGVGARLVSEINLISPSDNYTTNNTEIIFETSIEHIAELVNASLWINGNLNETNTISGLINETSFELSFNDGNYNWTIQSCDEDDDCGFATENRTFTIETPSSETPSSITINLTSPTDNLETSNEDITFTADINFTGIELNNITLYLRENEYITSGLNETEDYSYSREIISIEDGEYSWNITACGIITANSSLICADSETRSFELDATAPNVIASLENTILTSIGEQVVVNYNISDENIDTCWYEYGERETNSFETDFDDWTPALEWVSRSTEWSSDGDWSVFIQTAGGIRKNIDLTNVDTILMDIAITEACYGVWFGTYVTQLASGVGEYYNIALDVSHLNGINEVKIISGRLLGLGEGDCVTAFYIDNIRIFNTEEIELINCNQNQFSFNSVENFTTLTVYANDTFGNQNNSEVLSFSFSIAELPETLSPTNIGSTSALLRGQINDIGTATQIRAYFSYSEKEQGLWSSPVRVGELVTTGENFIHTYSLTGLTTQSEYRYFVSYNATFPNSSTSVFSGELVYFNTTFIQPLEEEENPLFKGVNIVNLIFPSAEDLDWTFKFIFVFVVILGISIFVFATLGVENPLVYYVVGILNIFALIFFIAIGYINIGLIVFLSLLALGVWFVYPKANGG